MTEKIGFSEVDERYDGESEQTNGSGITEYAGFWRRAGAYLIDGILISLAASSIVFILQLFNMLDSLTKKEVDGVESIFQFVIAFVYAAKMESSSLQGTYGKYMLKMKVTGLDGERITFGRASIRHFAKMLSTILLLIGFIMVAFTKKKQGLHDKIADTLVVRK
jgi:uncharacterized RDD family membrane protein YckC